VISVFAHRPAGGMIWARTERTRRGRRPDRRRWAGLQIALLDSIGGRFRCHRTCARAASIRRDARAWRPRTLLRAVTTKTVRVVDTA
jgi:hypothetical protein